MVSFTSSVITRVNKIKKKIKKNLLNNNKKKKAIMTCLHNNHLFLFNLNTKKF